MLRSRKKKENVSFVKERRSRLVSLPSKHDRKKKKKRTLAFERNARVRSTKKKEKKSTRRTNTDTPKKKRERERERRRRNIKIDTTYLFLSKHHHLNSLLGESFEHGLRHYLSATRSSWGSSSGRAVSGHPDA
jgi:uncharacterized membrane protein YdbT with pleckstrin-like domain